MIEVIEGEDIITRGDVIDEMFKMRAQVFHNRLKWDVEVEYGREFDKFDDENPVYLISFDEHTGVMQGSVRLLPTTGPNMLRDVFYDLLEEDEVIESPFIWESSRFSIDPNLGPDSRTSVNHVTAELLCGLVEIGLATGIDHIVSVYDARMTRLFRRAKCDADIVGGPMKFGKVPTYAGLFDITQERWNAIASVVGITSSVINPTNTSSYNAA